MNIYEYSGVNSQYICALQGHRSNYLCHGWRLERIPNTTGEDSNLAQPFQYLDHLASLWLLPAAIQLLAVGERGADLLCQRGPRMSHGKAATPRIPSVHACMHADNRSLQTRNRIGKLKVHVQGAGRGSSSYSEMV